MFGFGSTAVAVGRTFSVADVLVGVPAQDGVGRAVVHHDVSTVVPTVGIYRRKKVYIYFLAF